MQALCSPHSPQSHAALCPAGVANIIDAALEAGASVALLGATCSVPEEQAMSAAAFALGARRRASVHPRALASFLPKLPRNLFWHVSCIPGMQNPSQTLKTGCFSRNSFRFARRMRPSDALACGQRVLGRASASLGRVTNPIRVPSSSVHPTPALTLSWRQT